MIWIGCDTTRTRIHDKDIFSNNNSGSEKTILMTFVNHGQNWKTKKRKSGTNANYIPRIKKKSEGEIKGKMLRPQFKQKKIAAGRLPNLVWQPGQTSPTSHPIYIYIAISQIDIFFLTVNTFIHWIFNVMFNPVHYHCHPFTDIYKGLICVELKPFFTARKSDTPILWRACLLVVPAGLHPRTYSIRTLQ